jgi:hypothetical protein
MFRKPNSLISLILLTLLLTAPPAAAERPGWNEPPQAPGYDRNGLLKINADFFNLAAASGGDFYFWAAGEFAASAGLLSLPIASDPVALFYRSGGGAFAQSIEVPVDTAITHLTLFAGAQRLDEVQLLRPDGRSVEANPAGVAVQVYKHMRIVAVENPEPGRWRIEARGAGSCSIAIPPQNPVAIAVAPRTPDHDYARLSAEGNLDDVHPPDPEARQKDQDRPGHRPAPCPEPCRLDRQPFTAREASTSSDQPVPSTRSSTTVAASPV